MSGLRRGCSPIGSTARRHGTNVPVVLHHKARHAHRDMSASVANSGVASAAQGAIDRVCRLCQGTIDSGAGRFRVGDTEFHPRCFRFWLTMPVHRTDEPGR